MASEWEAIEALGVAIMAEAKARGIVVDEELKMASAVVVDETIRKVSSSLGIESATARLNYGHLIKAPDVLDTALAAIGRA